MYVRDLQGVFYTPGFLLDPQGTEFSRQAEYFQH